jgi:phosphatidate cytidylyltransferase
MQASPSSQLGLRLISAMVLIAILLVIGVLGRPALLLFALIVAIGLQYEWNQVAKNINGLQGQLGDKLWLMTALVTSLGVVVDQPLSLAVLALVAIPTITLSIVMIKGTTEAFNKGLIFSVTVAQWVFMFYGLVLPLVCLSIIKLPKGSAWFFLLLFVALGTDTLAYFAGKKWGKALLAPEISPGKTREGALGGLVGSLLFGLLALALFSPELPPLKTVIVALGAGPMAIAGDLWESLLKRLAGVKDSGQLIPGHGGIMDRIDSILWVAPWVYAIAIL